MAKGITAQEMDATTASGLVPHLGTTTNSGNSYSVTSNTPISTNQKFTIKFNVASSTDPTLKINNDTALPIKKANGNNAKLYASVYTLFRDGSVFILQGEGGDYGTVAAADVLTGKTFGTDNGLVNGTMPNRSAENNHMPGLESTVWPGDRFFIRPPHGYFNGSTWVTAAVSGLTANNLRAGVNVAGLLGTLIEGKPFASGSATVKGPMEIGTELGGRQNTAYIEVSGLAFVPKRIVVHNGAYVLTIHVAEYGITGIIQNIWNNLYGNYFAQVFSGTYFTIPVSSKNTAIIGSTVYWEVYG